MIPRMPKGMENMLIANIGTEVLYSFIIIVCSLMIYFGTKELYEISRHRGIKFFRLTFLFFALAYFSRSFIKMIILYSNSSSILSVSPLLFNPIIGKLSLFFFVYLSTMAIFFLLYSIKCKKWENFPNTIILMHAIAILVSLFVIITQNGIFYLIINTIIFLSVLLAAYTSKDRKQKTGIHAIYSLLSFFWILNTIDLILPEFFQTTQILVYLASSSIFMLILYKTLKKTGN
jgi:hypothetical protein